MLSRASDAEHSATNPDERTAPQMKARTRSRIAITAAAAAVLLTAAVARADGISSEQGQEILNELKQIRQLLERMQNGGQAGAVDDKVSYKLAPGGLSLGDA